MQNVRSLVPSSEFGKPAPEAEPLESTQLAIAHTAWLQQAYTTHFLVGLQEEADNKLEQAMNMSAVSGNELQLRTLLIEAKLLRNIVSEQKAVKTHHENKV